MANAIAQTLLAKRTHKIVGRDKIRACSLAMARSLSLCLEK